MPHIQKTLGSVLAFFLFLSTGRVYVQAQTTPSVTLDHGDVLGGETVKIIVTLGQAPTCPSTIFIGMNNTANSQGFSFSGYTVTANKTVTLSTFLPKDLNGTFRGRTLSLSPCEGYSQSNSISFPEIELNVKPVPDTNTYSTTAAVSLLLSQKQFLQTQADDLVGLSGQIDLRIEQGGRDSVELRSFLTKIVEAARTDLVRTEKKYQTEVLKPSESIPPFFADFRRQYENLRTELRAPIPGISATLGPPVHLVYAQQQLQRRTPQQEPRRSGNTSGTSPAIAIAVKQAVTDNASAYRIASTTGIPKFHVEFSSRPQGASIFYRQAILQDFMLWSSVTDTTGAEFDLATFVFKFHKDGCRDEPVRTIDPYYDTHPIISVEFRNCSGH